MSSAVTDARAAELAEALPPRAVLRRKSAELAVAGFFTGLGALVIADSLRLGVRWAEDGPEAGTFPVYVGVLICVSSLATALRALRAGETRSFVDWTALRGVMCVLAPTAIYTALIGPLGLYVASALFVGFFMRWLGGYAWWKVGSLAIGNSVVFFLIFEHWFQVPLPKGPLEAWLGLL